MVWDGLGEIFYNVSQSFFKRAHNIAMPFWKTLWRVFHALVIACTCDSIALGLTFSEFNTSKLIMVASLRYSTTFLFPLLHILIKIIV